MKNNKKLVKKEIKITKQDRINHYKKCISSPELLLSYKEDNLIKDYIENRDKLSDDEKNQIAFNLIQLSGLENGYWLGHISYEKNKLPLIKIKKTFIEENNCKGSIELMLADKIVASYWRVMKYEQVFNHFIENEEDQFSCSQLTINMLKEVNRGLEIAHRQLDNNIILFKELKQPNFKLTVKTDSAYFAENQQIINNTKNSEKLEGNNEIIKG